jgi:hypothetical protein
VHGPDRHVVEKRLPLVKHRRAMPGSEAALRRRRAVLPDLLRRDPASRRWTPLMHVAPTFEPPSGRCGGRLALDALWPDRPRPVSLASVKGPRSCQDLGTTSVPYGPSGDVPGTGTPSGTAGASGRSGPTPADPFSEEVARATGLDGVTHHLAAGRCRPRTLPGPVQLGVVGIRKGVEVPLGDAGAGVAQAFLDDLQIGAAGEEPARVRGAGPAGAPASPALPVPTSRATRSTER